MYFIDVGVERVTDAERAIIWKCCEAGVKAVRPIDREHCAKVCPEHVAAIFVLIENESLAKTGP
jgi:hypothetical protein